MKQILWRMCGAYASGTDPFFLPCTHIRIFVGKPALHEMFPARQVIVPNKAAPYSGGVVVYGRPPPGHQPSGVFFIFVFFLRRSSVRPGKRYPARQPPCGVPFQKGICQKGVFAEIGHAFFRVFLILFVQSFPGRPGWLHSCVCQDNGLPSQRHPGGTGGIVPGRGC